MAGLKPNCKRYSNTHFPFFLQQSEIPKKRSADKKYRTFDFLIKIKTQILQKDCNSKKFGILPNFLSIN